MNNAVQDRYAGKHIVVTGAGTGIGRAIAHRLWSEGAKLTLLARNAQRLEVVAGECLALRSAAPDEIGFAPCDIRERGDLDRLLAEAAGTRGKLHGLVANAGVGGANMDGAEDRFDELVSINLVGTYNSFRAAQQQLADAASGARHLIAISSILARIGVPAYTGYCASKTGILGLVRALSAELAEEEVQVNTICPGWVDTQMARDGVQGMADAMGLSYDEAHATAMSAVPLGRMSQPEDIAGMVAWLMSADARGVTGQSLDMNGGAWL